MRQSPPLVVFRVLLAIAVTTGVVASTVLPAQAAAGAEAQPPTDSAPHPPRVGPGPSQPASSATQRDSARHRASRRASRSAFSGLTASAVLELARRRHLDSLTGSLWRPAGGARVLRYLDENTARVQRQNGRAGLVESVLPLRAADENGVRRPIDVTLRRSSNVLRPANPLADLRIGSAADDGIALGASRVRLKVADASSAKAQLLAGRAVFPNALRDTDLVALPLPDGVQLFWQLRSRRSPEALALSFEMPAGATLREARNDLGGFEIVRDGQPLARVGLPATLDAAGKPIPTSYRLEGRTLHVRVSHTEADVSYPLLVDPEVTEDFRHWRGGGVADYNGWDYVRTPARTDSTKFKMSRGPDGYLGEGMYIYSRGLVTYTTSDYARWFFDVRGHGDAYIYRADFDLLYKQTFGEPALQTEELRVGLQDVATGAWQGDSPRVVTGNDYSYAARRACLRTGCGFGGVRPNPSNSSARYNRAVLEARMLTGGLHNDWTMYMGGAAIFQADDVIPTGAIRGLPTGWVRDATGMTASFADTGLGMKTIALATEPSQRWNQTSRGVTDGCTGDRNRPCPRDLTATFDAGDLPDGIHTISATGTDIIGTGRTERGTLRLDRTAPVVELGGDLFESIAQPLAGDTYDLWVDARDERSGAAQSGVRSSRILVDNVAVAEREEPCQPHSCDMELEWDMLREKFKSGQHTVRVEVRDWADNLNVQTFTFELTAQQGPSPDPSEGEGPSMSRDDEAARYGVGPGCPQEFEGAQAQRVTSYTNGVRTAGGTETTARYFDGSYRVAYCDLMGTLVVSQHVAPIPTPDGVAMLVVAETKPVTGGELEVNQYLYGSATDPYVKQAWGRDKLQILANVIPPTTSTIPRP